MRLTLYRENLCVSQLINIKPQRPEQNME